MPAQSLSDAVLERGLPASVDAERSILGSILLENEHFYEAAALIDDRDFCMDGHQRIFQRMADLLNGGHPVDIVTLAEQLMQRKEVESVGGVAYLASLTEGLPRRLNIREYVAIVREKAMLRATIQLAEDISLRAATQDESAEALITELDRAALSIASHNMGAGVDLVTQSNRAYSNLLAIRAGTVEEGYSLGLEKLQYRVGGIGRAVLTVLGGRPQMGKSSFLAQLVLHNCPLGNPVHLFSIEMTADAFLERLWAARSGVPFSNVHHPKRASDEEWKRVTAAMGEVATWPLIIDDVANVSADQLVARARVVKRQQGTKILGIDYLQKMHFGSGVRHRHQDITDACVQLASFAKTENVGTLLLSSITENSDKNRNVAPTLADFRGSGDIAFEAHTALIIHRKVDPESEKVDLNGQLIIAKGRTDASGVIPVLFNPRSLTFEEQA